MLTDEAIDALDGLADRFDAAGTDVELLLELDRDFHLATFVPEAMPHSFRIARDFWNRTQRYRRRLMSSLSAEQVAMVSMEHRFIIGSIRERDAEGAGERHRLHVRHTRIRLARRPDILDSMR